jgi:hypothetical protein
VESKEDTRAYLYNLQRYGPSDPLHIARPHLPKSLEPPQTAPSVGDQAFNK